MRKNGNRSDKPARGQNGKSKDVSQIFAERTLVDKALKSAVREALLDHKRAGNPICVWRDGKVVWIPPEKIKVPRRWKTSGAARPERRAKTLCK